MNITDPPRFAAHVRRALRHGPARVERLAREDVKAMLIVASPTPAPHGRVFFFILATAEAAWVFAVFRDRGVRVFGRGCDSDGFVLAPPELLLVSTLLAGTDRAPHIVRGHMDDFAELAIPVPLPAEPVLVRIAALLADPDLSGADLHDELVDLLTASGRYPPAADLDEREFFAGPDDGPRS